MKLELKHIAPYLPYGLKEFHNGEIIGIRNWDGLCAEFAAPWGSINIPIGTIKPMLQSFSEMTKNPKEIREDIENFIGLGNWCDAYHDYLDMFFENHCVSDDAQKANYPIFQYFLFHNYDVFGLIPQGLAFDINTITSNK